MTDRFVALDVGEGDAFFLERDRFTVLVDGGKAPNFSERFKGTLGRTGVDVLVCTHNDADHANGIIDFLDHGLTAGECWLPASWLEALEDLLEEPVGVILDIVFRGRHDGAEETAKRKASDADREEMPPEADEAPRPRRGGPELSVDRIGGLLESAARKGAHGLVHERLIRALKRTVARGQQLEARTGGRFRVLGRKTLQLLIDAHNIRAIAIAAAKRRIRIRWFDPEVVPGRPAPSGPLQVVNATEVQVIRRTDLPPRDVLGDAP